MKEAANTQRCEEKKISKSLRNLMKRQQRGESRPTVIGAAENAEPSVRVEWHLTEGRHVSGVEPHLPGLDRASPPPPGALRGVPLRATPVPHTPPRSDVSL